jgi:hypothetical protein
MLQVAVITKFPGLVDLQGPARINQTDIESIMGFTGGLGQTVLSLVSHSTRTQSVACNPSAPFV